MIIGFTAIAGAGKDTAASAFDKNKTTFFAFATVIKKITNMLFDISYEYLQDAKLKETLDVRYNKSPRQIMQHIGDSMRLVDEDVFVNQLDNIGSNITVITDVRYDNECIKIKSLGGIIVKIVRPGAITTVHNQHSSEKGVSEQFVDYTIINDGSIEELVSKVREIVDIILV